MECSVCKRSDLDLVETLYENEITSMCRSCAKLEGAMIIRKPTQEQIAAAHKRLPLVETIARMKNPRFVRTMSHDQSVANRNLSKIRFPEAEQKDSKLIENYYWELQMARRRKKLPISEVAKITHIPEDVIAGMEKGILPPKFEQMIKDLELALGVKLLKSHSHEIHFKMPERFHEDVPENVRQEIERELQSESTLVKRPEKSTVKAPASVPAPAQAPRNSRTMDALSRIARGKADFSRDSMSGIRPRDLSSGSSRPEGWAPRPRMQGHQLESQKQQRHQSQQQEQKAQSSQGSSSSSGSSSDEPDIEFFE